MIRAIAWDIDGTLIDSEPLHHRALLAGMAQFGANISDLPEERFRGVHMPDVWAELRERLPAALSYDEWLEKISAYYAGNSQDLVAIDEAVETIEMLAVRGLRQVCVSNSDRAIVDANIAHLGVLSHLDFSISLSDVSKGKPDPEPYLLAAARLDLSPEEIIAVEDSTTGLSAARAAGMTVVGYRLPAAAAGGAVRNMRHLSELAVVLDELS